MANNSAVINGVTYFAKDGLTLSKNANENLDNIVCVIPQISEIVGLEPYDIARVYRDETLITSLLVGDITTTIASFSPLKYNYFMSLLSPTQKLKMITLPNLSVTQPLMGDKRDILYHLNRIKQVYLENESDIYYYSDDLIAKATGVVCPEEAFNKSTVYEFLSAIVKPLNILIKVNIDEDDNFEIGYLDLNERGTELDMSVFSEVTSQRLASEYVSELDIETENALYPLGQGADTYTRCVHRSTPRYSGGTQITDENLELILPFPIYRLEKVEIEYFYLYDQVSIKSTLDITSYILEETEYNTLRDGNLVSIDETKAQSLYYKFGSNIIGGLGYKASLLSDRALTNIIKDNHSFIDIVSTPLEKILFNVTYVTLANVRMRTSKAIKLKHDAVMINNQQNSFVDLKLLGENEKQNVNRLGNNKLVAIGRFDDYDDAPTLFDTYGKYVLTSIEYCFNENDVCVKAEFSKNFVNKTSFTGLSYKKRITSIANPSEAFVRHDIIKRYNAFSFSNLASASYAFNNYLLKTIIDQTTLGVNALVWTTDSISGDVYPYLSSGFTKYTSGNSVLISFGAEDNYSAGLKVYDKNNKLQEKKRYVNSKGEFDKLSIYVYSKYGDFMTLAIANETVMEDRYELYSMLYPAFPQPLVTSSDLIYSIVDKKLMKDNREITKITLQDEFLSDDEDIIVGTRFVEKNVMIRDLSNLDTLYLYSSTTAEYSAFENQLCKGNYTNLVFSGEWQNITLTDNYIEVTTDESWKSWAIGDEDGNMYLGVNGNNGKIYLNVKNNR